MCNIWTMPYKIHRDALNKYCWAHKSNTIAYEHDTEFKWNKLMREN